MTHQHKSAFEQSNMLGDPAPEFKGWFPLKFRMQNSPQILKTILAGKLQSIYAPIRQSVEPLVLGYEGLDQTKTVMMVLKEEFMISRLIEEATKMNKAMGEDPEQELDYQIYLTGVLSHDSVQLAQKKFCYYMSKMRARELWVKAITTSDVEAKENALEEFRNEIAKLNQIGIDLVNNHHENCGSFLTNNDETTVLKFFYH